MFNSAQINQCDTVIMLANDTTLVEVFLQQKYIAEEVRYTWLDKPNLAGMVLAWLKLVSYHDAVHMVTRYFSDIL